MNSIKENTKKHASKIVASVITLSIITLIILAGPAGAFVLNLNDFTNSNPTKGDLISALFTLTINSNERMSLPNPVGIYMDGSAVALCSFSADGSSSDCAGKGINVSLVSNGTSYGYDYGYGYGYEHSYGYGYGYGYNNGYSGGVLTYKITFDTSYFSVGTHDIQLKVDAGDGDKYKSNSKTITINAASLGGHGGGNGIGSTIILNGNEEENENNFQNLGTGNEEENGTNTTTPTQGNFFTNFLTGAVTGITNFSSSPGGIGTIIILFTAVIGGIVFFSFRRFR
jgi:hypothetical protein